MNDNKHNHNGYIAQNKAAWEEAYDHRINNWGEQVVADLKNDPASYVHPAIKEFLDGTDIAKRNVAQFCCNNGREVLSLVAHYQAQGVGFDIAQNQIDQARIYARELDLPCDFVATDILEIDASYNGIFDVVIFTIGAITWFEDLDALFKVVARTLKPGGIMIIHDFHPIMNMLALPDEADYQPGPATLVANRYFSKQPWVENTGIGYISGTYDSKTFISFSHSLTTIINTALKNDLNLMSFNEYDYDVGLSDVYDNQGLPLSFLMVAKKTTEY